MPTQTNSGEVKREDATTVLLGKKRIALLRKVSKAMGESQSWWLRRLVDQHLSSEVEVVLKEKTAAASQAMKQ